MRRIAGWIVLIGLLSIAFHVAGLWYLPRFLTARTVAAIYEQRPDWHVNRLGHAGLRFAGTDIVVRDNPDTVTSFGAYDISRAPLRIHCVTPPGDNYWSVSLYDWNTDNYYVVNDRDAPAPVFDLILVAPDSLYEPLPEERIVVSPSSRGVVLARIVVTDRDDPAELESIEDLQRQTWIRPVEGVIY